MPPSHWYRLGTARSSGIGEIEPVEQAVHCHERKSGRQLVPLDPAEAVLLVEALRGAQLDRRPEVEPLDALHLAPAERRVEQAARDTDHGAAVRRPDEHLAQRAFAVA